MRSLIEPIFRLFMVFCVVAGAAESARAAKVPVAGLTYPRQIFKESHSQTWTWENASYLRDTSVLVDPNEAAALSWLDPAESRQFREEYERMQAQTETQKANGSWQPSDDEHQAERRKELSNSYLQRVVSYKISEGFRQAEKNSPEVRQAKGGYQVVGAIAKSNAAVDVAPGFQFGTRTDVPKRRARLWMNSSLVNSDLDFKFGNPTFDPWSSGPVAVAGLEELDESTRLTLSRAIPWIGIGTRFAYGMDSHRHVTTLTKQLSNPLAVEYMLAQGGDREDERRLRLTFGLQF